MRIIYLLLSIIIFLEICLAEEFSRNKFEILSGVRQNKDEKSLWDTKYAHSQYVFGKTPAKFLANNFDYIPEGSHVLDMGMGEGRNAVFLARKGFKVTGVDISSVAVKKAKALAKEFGVRIDTVITSMTDYKIPDGTFDAIICFYYVERSLHEKMIKWLKPGGILVYEAHTENQLKVPGNELYSKKYLLKPSELLTLFPNLRILKYEEPLHLREYTTSIILQKLK